MKTSFDRRKSLQELEQEDWGKPNDNSSLVQKCYRLRQLPLEDFEAGDLRIMIGQQISLLFLVPLALEMLAEDPLVEGNYYRGDLLTAVLNIPERFWSVHSDMRNVLRRIVVETKDLLTTFEEGEAHLVRETLAKALDFLGE